MLYKLLVKYFNFPITLNDKDLGQLTGKRDGKGPQARYLWWSHKMEGERLSSFNFTGTQAGPEAGSFVSAKALLLKEKEILQSIASQLPGLEEITADFIQAWPSEFYLSDVNSVDLEKPNDTLYVEYQTDDFNREVTFYWSPSRGIEDLDWYEYAGDTEED